MLALSFKNPRFSARVPLPLPSFDATKPGSIQPLPELLNAPGHLVILSGPSGVGKGSAKSGLFSDPVLKDDVIQIKSLKTRALRPGEADDSSDCIRITPDSFAKAIAEGKLFQYVTYNGQYYGSWLGDVKAAMQSGNVAFMEMTAEIALQAKSALKDKVTTIFMAPEKREELLERLRKRGSDDELTNQRRYAASEAELKLQDHFDEIIVSRAGQIPQSQADLKAVIAGILQKIRPGT